MLDQYTPDQLNAFWAGVTGIAAVATGVVASLTLRSLQRDSIDRTRPVIAIDVVPIVLSHGTCELVVENVGQSVAKDVRVIFDPPVTEEMGKMASFLARRYSKAIPTMVPGRRLANVYAHWLGDGTDALVEEVPKEFRATAKYVDSHGREYEDSYVVSLETLRNQTTSTPGSTNLTGLEKRWVKALEAIAAGVNR